MPQLVISLDFEMFWGVTDSKTIENYGPNIEGEWEAIPKILSLFKRYDVQATWATVGMLMCRDYDQWLAMKPTELPGYVRQDRSNYSFGALARDYPKLFFGRPLVEQILSTPGQELASHTYSHFYCAEAGATPKQFAADLDCAGQVASDLGVRYRSLVLPRNQVRDEFIDIITHAGIKVYRGNQGNWLYKNGSAIPGGKAGRAIRLADSFVPLTGALCASPSRSDGLVNLPASHFLRPWSRRIAALYPLHLCRLKRAMTEAARTNQICHLWWHPHNFGVNVEQNLTNLETLLQHYLQLKDKYGMQSSCMGDFTPEEAT